MPPTEDRVNALLSVWEHRRAAGDSVSVEELCRDAPDVLAEVRRRVAALKDFDAAATASPSATRPRLPDAAPPPDVPGFAVVGELGRGGMGVVYRAVQLDLNRVVALKMVRGGRATAAERQRFRAEAEALARLRHPNVVPVYAVGEHAGEPYFALEFVDGGSLDRHLNGTPIEPRTAAALVATVAAAVHAAHLAGIIHRDLKPGNVLLQPPHGRPPADTPLAEFTPKVGDFGLAKAVDSDAGRTADGAVVGTPSYMAPEQAAGKGKEVGPAADVYALGAILYELLTGRPPFRAASAWETIALVIGQPPIPPGRFVPRLPKDLETVCLKCLEKGPSARYPSALALADDLRRFLDGRPTAARPVSAWVRGWKWACRRPTAATLLVVLAVGVPALVGLLVTMLGEARQRAAAVQDLGAARTDLARLRGERTAEEAKLADLRRAVVEQEEAQYARDLQFGVVAWERAEVPELRRLLDRHRPPPGTARRFEWRLLDRWANAPLFPRSPIPPADQPMSDAAVWAHLRRHWDFNSFPELAEVGGPWAVHPGKMLFARGTLLGTVHVLDRDGNEVTTLHTGGKVAAVAFDPSGGRLAVAAEDKTVTVWEVAKKQVVATCREHADLPVAVAFAFGGKWVVSRSLDGVGVVWEADTGKVVFRATGVRGLPAVSGDGKLVAAGVGADAAKVWAVDGGKELRTLTGHREPVRGVAFGPRGELATASDDRTVKVWTPAGVHTLTLRGHALAPARVAFNADGTRLASTDAAPLLTGEVRVWDATRPPEYRPFRPLDPDAAVWMDGVQMLALGGDGTTAAAGGGSWFAPSRLAVWRVGPPDEVAFSFDVGKRTDGFPDVLLGLAVSPDGRTLAFTAGSPDRPADRIGFAAWDARSGRRLFSHKLFGHIAAGLAFSPDGKTVAVAGGDRVFLRDAVSGDETAVLTAPPRPGDLRGRELEVKRGDHTRIVPASAGPGAVAFDRTGRKVVAAHADGRISVWDRDRPDAPVSLVGHPDRRVNAVTFSADGSLVASAAEDGARLWDPTDGTPLHALATHRGAVTGAAFHPTESRLATTGADGTIRLWEPTAGREVLVLPAGSPPAVVWFAPDGNSLVTAHDDGTVRTWDTSPHPPVRSRP